jgi:hypothetical protein
MTTFGYNKPPKQWTYVPTKRQIRQFIEDNGFPVVRVDFKGTAGFPGDRCEHSPYGMGFLHARVVNGAWRFYLQFWAIRAQLASEYGENIAVVVLSEIKAQIAACVSRAAVETEKPTELHLMIAADEDGVRSRSSSEQVDTYSFWAGAWWEAEDV